MPHGLGHHVIMKMADRFLERGHHLFFDNYFSSVKLGQDLEGKGTYMCSTIRMNRSGWPKELNAQCAKKIKAGDVHFCQYGNTVATQWKEKRPVAILYTNTQPEMGEAERKARGGRARRWQYQIAAPCGSVCVLSSGVPQLPSSLRIWFDQQVRPQSIWLLWVWCWWDGKTLIRRQSITDSERKKSASGAFLKCTLFWSTTNLWVYKQLHLAW